MAAFCLPKKYASAFMTALKDGTIVPSDLLNMTSAERREFFQKIVGDDNAHDVNALFESKMLLKDQQRGLVNWAKTVAGISDATRADLASRIAKMDRVLQPEDEDAFLADLAAQKLGVGVSAQEAEGIYNLAKVAETRKAEMLKDLGNVDNRIAYGRSIMDLNEMVESLKPQGRSFTTKLIDILNIPKSALTSILHFSAPFVQGWGMLSTQRAWEAFGQMFRYFGNEENYKNLNAYIISHPDYPLAKSGKLGLTKLGDKLSAREEALQSTLVEQANQYLSDKTGVPNLVRASSRAFTGYLNYVRFNRFTDLLNAARLSGEDIREGTSAVNDLAKVVNDFTGRGAIGVGDKYAQAAPALNAMFFSPRKISATMQMFNPVRYLNPAISPTARRAAIRQLSGSLIATGAVLSLAKAMGASVSFDPRDANFAKADINGEKLDMTGGNSIYLRLLARIATNQEITSKGKLIELGQGYKPLTRADLLLQYIRGKLSPIASAVTDSLYGKDAVGRPFSVTQEMQDKLVPITISEFINYAESDADNTVAILPSLSAIFGVGLESPLPPLTKTDQTAWGQPAPMIASSPHDPVDKELARLQYTPNFPSEKIRGVQLDDAQYSDYVRIGGRLAKMRLDELVQMPGWDSIPDAGKLSLIHKSILKAHDSAAKTVMMKYQGTDHDIVALATAAKQAQRASMIPATTP